MYFSSGQQFLEWPQKAITLFGMSGVGKTRTGNMLRAGDWYLYSVDYRIGTRYMGEHIVDNFKREAMKVPFLRDLLKSDSIYISSNITFENLEPLSTYLGKPGNPDKGGIAFDDYRQRQAQHRKAEIAALLDMEEFLQRARTIYGYRDFLCDCGGSLCEVVDPQDRDDPVLNSLSDHSLMVHIRGAKDHAETLIDRFRAAPKPMYYQPRFLEEKWAEYKALNGISDDNKVDPDGFAVWGFSQLVTYRIPLYEQIASRYGYTIDMADLEKVTSHEDFLNLLANAVEMHAKDEKLPGNVA